MSNSDPAIVIIGAGAAGLMAAIHAARGGHRVDVIEATSDGGRKILISGGGRCNVLPSELDHRRYVTASSSNSLRKILLAWPLGQQRAFFESEIGLPLVLEPESGKLFPVANKSRAVRDALVNHARQIGVRFRTNTRVVSIAPAEGSWRVDAFGGEQIICQRLVITTGGLSVPQTGSDGFGFKHLAQLGHTIHPTYPALTPLVSEPAGMADLAGVSLPVKLTAVSETEVRNATGGFLFTHRGYSGPALLDVSHIAVRGRLAGNPPARLEVAWLAATASEWTERLAPAAKSVGTVIRSHLPSRLADRLMLESAVETSTPLAQLTREQRLRLIKILTAFELPWSSDEGYKKAEVTGGGLALGEVNPQTMESRLHRGLFIAGEVLDAFGPIGGYNFVWAWVTGRLAGLGAASQ
jgi:predicted Rossmann fold flavoprotein